MKVTIQIDGAAPGQIDTEARPDPAGAADAHLERFLDATVAAAEAPRAGIVVAGDGTVLVVQAGAAEGTYDVLVPGCGDRFEVVSSAPGGIEDTARAAALDAARRFGGIAWAGGPTELVRAVSKVAAQQAAAAPQEPDAGAAN